MAKLSITSPTNNNTSNGILTNGISNQFNYVDSLVPCYSTHQKTNGQINNNKNDKNDYSISNSNNCSNNNNNNNNNNSQLSSSSFRQVSYEFNEEQDSCLQLFEKWSPVEQTEFCENILRRMCHFQHGHINNFLKPMLQRDFISSLPGKLMIYIYIYIYYIQNIAF